MSVTMIKVGVQVDGYEYNASIENVFGSIPLDEIEDLNCAIYDAVHQIDFDGEDMMNCEGYAELVFKMEPIHDPDTNSFDRIYYCVESYYQPLI